jgi:hypothetical protein
MSCIMLILWVFSRFRRHLQKVMAESEGFEPPIDLRLCLISSQVHSTGLCQLSALLYFISGLRLAACASQARLKGRSQIYPDTG